MWRSTVVACALLVASSAHAQGGAGVRAGVSIDPDQFYVGGHADLGPLAGRLWLRPNLEIGFGNDLTLVAVNLELAYWFSPRAAWRPYVGAGPALNVYRAFGESNSEAGLNFVVGVGHRKGFFGEVKLGAFDSPDLKIGFGYTFR